MRVVRRRASHCNSGRQGRGRFAVLPPVASAALTPYVVGFLPDGLDIGARSWYIGLARPVALRFVRGRSARNVRAQPKPPPDSPGGGFLMLGPPSSRAGKSALYRAPAALIYLIQSRQNAPNATKPLLFCCVSFDKGLLYKFKCFFKCVLIPLSVKVKFAGFWFLENRPV